MTYTKASGKKTKPTGKELSFMLTAPSTMENFSMTNSTVRALKAGTTVQNTKETILKA